jgi:hypothetical protein
LASAKPAIEATSSVSTTVGTVTSTLFSAKRATCAPASTAA